MQPFKLSNLFHGQTSLRNTIFSVLIFGVKLLVIHNWFKECWWIASYVFLRAWNFQGYQRNSMWNIQGLIKNTMEFPRDLAQFCGISRRWALFYLKFKGVRLWLSFEFGNGSGMPDKNLIILEFKYLQNKKW